MLTPASFIRFLKDRRGNVATIFALSFLPIVGLTGAAIDYSRANSVKTAMQAALDATALQLSKSAATMTQGQLQTSATAYFQAVFNRPDAQNIQITPVYTASTSTLTVNGSAKILTDFMKIMGMGTLNIGTSSTVTWGTTRLRVALVLDNTGSMSSAGKIDALKTATNTLLAQLKATAANNGDVYVSIIPFVKDVNLGAANYNSNWIDWTDWDANNGTCGLSGNYPTKSACQAQGTCSLSGYTTQSACTGAGTCSVSGNSTQTACSTAGTCSLAGYTSQSTCTGAGTCSNPGETTQSSCTGTKACTKSQYTTKSSCKNNGGTWGNGTWTYGSWTAATWTPATWTSAAWTPKNHNTWNGCVTDRGDTAGPNSANYDTNVAAPATGIPASLFPAEQYGSCPQAVMGLNYDWSAMTSLVNNMGPNGNTNQAIGLALGWMSLVGGGPFTAPPMDPNYQYTQIIILLTDGLNTQDRWYTSQSSIDARQQMTCNNIRAAKITLYTIQVNTGGDPTSTLLQNCATTSDKFFLLTSASQMISTFQQIGTQIAKLHLSK